MKTAVLITALLGAGEGLDLLGSPDTVAGRRRFIERLDGFICNERERLAGDVPLSKPFERGWFWGSEAFRERLVARIEKMGKRKSRHYRSRKEGPTKNHGKKRAAEILTGGAKHFGVTEEELRRNLRGDWRRRSVAWAIAKETSVPQAWIAEWLNLKSDANASQQVRRLHQAPDKELPQEVRAWKVSRNVA